jgi:RsiW-degrading membrane proteinase PrsW (M82 family)
MTAAAPPALRRRPDRPFLRFGCLAVVLGFFGLCMMFTALYTGLTFAQGPWVFTLAVFLASTTALPYGLLLMWLDRNEQEPLVLLAAAFMWGAVVSTAISLVANTSFGIFAMGLVGHPGLASQMTASFSAPLFEEGTKGIALIFLFFLFRRHFDNVLDGMLYGALIGLGFAWLENILYYVQASGSGDGAMGMLKLTYLRGVVNGLSSHVTYTGLTGMGFGLVRILRKGVLRWLLVPVFWGLAMFAHFLWNTFAGIILGVAAGDSELAAYAIGLPLAVLLLQIPFMLLLGITGLATWIHEVRIIRRYLGSESDEVASAADVHLLVPAYRRVLASTRRFFSGGPLFWLRHQLLDRDRIRLAFVKWHLDHDPDTPWSAEEDHDVAVLRHRIRARRTTLEGRGR